DPPGEAGLRAAVSGGRFVIGCAVQSELSRHARTCCGHPRLCPIAGEGRFHGKRKSKAWMAATSAAMTNEDGEVGARAYFAPMPSIACFATWIRWTRSSLNFSAWPMK